MCALRGRCLDYDQPDIVRSSPKDPRCRAFSQRGVVGLIPPIYGKLVFVALGARHTLLNGFAACVVLAGIATASACGAAGDDAAVGQDRGPDPTAETAALPLVDPPTPTSEATATTSETCGADAAASKLAEAQFAFVGSVAAVEEQVHPWTTDPENPDRADVAETTRWVRFDVERWYTTDWGTSFSVWAPTFAMQAGERFAVGGDAYHTEVPDFSGQSGEVEVCALLARSESTPADWDNFFGEGAPPSNEDPDSGIEPEAATGVKVFGENTQPCDPTVLNNGSDDEIKISEGAACFVREFEAGRPLVWDVVFATTEGDPIPSRYDYDGAIVSITTDYSFDNYGSGGVSELRCTGVRPTNWLPEGIDCSSHTAEGFRPDSLPYGP